MKISVTFPFDHIDPPAEFSTMEAVAEIAQTVERLGFYGGTLTDHPCPTGRWLDQGGHHAQDPFVMLSLIAAHTKTLKLQTSILVLPYRNPFITARAVSTLDVFSQGRVVLGVGAGYLKAEYHALGVDFDRRNELMDEYILAMKAAWASEEDFEFEGSGYKALGNRILPHPVQKPHPPILVGGNSKRAIRRAAEMGDAWYPFFVPGSVTATARTAKMEADEDIGSGIAYMHAHCEKIGRTDLPGVFCTGVLWSDEDKDCEALAEHIGGLGKLGVSGVCVQVGGHTRAEYCDKASQLAEHLLPKLD